LGFPSLQLRETIVSVLLVANPKAGSTSTALVDEVAGLCRAAGHAVAVHHTTRRGDATDVVAGCVAEPPELVVAIGGDGTVCEVAAGLLAHDGARRPNLFAVPGGTGNSGYRMLWGARPWQASLTAVLRGRPAVVRRIDAARLVEADAFVLLGACAGLFADALVTARSSAKRGWARYDEALRVTAEQFRPFPSRVRVDGGVLWEGDTVLANVGGGRFRAGQFQLLPRSLVDDRLLDVCVIGAGLPARAALALARDGRHLAEPDVRYGRGRRISVERLDGEPLCFEHDGEVQADPPRTMTLEVLPHALPMWAAPRHAGRAAA
jgi:diacylglycerol kinase (ATP)